MWPRIWCNVSRSPNTWRSPDRATPSAALPHCCASGRVTMAHAGDLFDDWQQDPHIALESLTGDAYNELHVGREDSARMNRSRAGAQKKRAVE